MNDPICENCERPYSAHYFVSFPLGATIEDLGKRTADPLPVHRMCPTAFFGFASEEAAAPNGEQLICPKCRQPDPDGVPARVFER